MSDLCRGACSSSVTLSQCQYHANPHYHIHNWSTPCWRGTRGLITLLILTRNTGFLCDNVIRVWILLACVIKTLLMLLSMLNLIESFIVTWVRYLLSFPIIFCSISSYWRISKQDMVMRRVISEAEAGEPVTNDLYEGHCGQTSQGIILMQDVYSK